ncbi:ORF147 [Saltwater crocodilepox virus]|nr:Early transcription factor [Saltwater crocodilepox virus]AVD69481.1 Early transcription factor [Saltwater crocodilepox virus]QGT46585.1 ORF147 [Saltwater crocodilepox virus]QGT46800.1 ORF147 [Saltwater crocodilepox virus]QGT47016.1 ORF147 [Saltwater crocodilepox virus]
MFRMLMLGTMIKTFLYLDTIRAKMSAMMVFPEPMMWKSRMLCFSTRMRRTRKSTVAIWWGRRLGIVSTCSLNSLRMLRFI